MSSYKNGIQTRERIIETARELFYTKGYEQTTYKDLCGAVGISPGTFHHHFPTKAELYQVIYRQMIRQNIEEARALTGSKDRTMCGTMETLLFWYKFFADAHYRAFSVLAPQILYQNDPKAYFGVYQCDVMSAGEDPFQQRMEELKSVSRIGISYILYPYLNDNLERFSYQDAIRFNMMCTEFFGTEEDRRMPMFQEVCIQLLEQADKTKLKTTF